MEDAETKQDALEKASDLEEELARVSERLTDTETEAMSQQVNRLHILFLFLILFFNILNCTKKFKSILLTWFGLGPFQMSEIKEFESQRLQFGVNEALTFENKLFVCLHCVLLSR